MAWSSRDNEKRRRSDVKRQGCSWDLSALQSGPDGTELVRPEARIASRRWLGTAAPHQCSEHLPRNQNNKPINRILWFLVFLDSRFVWYSKDLDTSGPFKRLLQRPRLLPLPDCLAITITNNSTLYIVRTVYYIYIYIYIYREREISFFCLYYFRTVVTIASGAPRRLASATSCRGWLPWCSRLVISIRR